MITLLRNNLWTFLTVLIASFFICAHAFGDAVEIQEKQPAPFSGILLTIDRATEAREAIIQRDALRVVNTDQEKKIEALASQTDAERIAYFIIGVAVSGAAFYVIHSYTH